MKQGERSDLLRSVGKFIGTKMKEQADEIRALREALTKLESRLDRQEALNNLEVRMARLEGGRNGGSND